MVKAINTNRSDCNLKYAIFCLDKWVHYPGGPVITNGTSASVDAASVVTSYGWVEFTFGRYESSLGGWVFTPSLTANTQYHMVLKSSQASADGTNYFAWGVDGSSPTYANGQMALWNGSTWTGDSTKDAAFNIGYSGSLSINGTWALATGSNYTAKIYDATDASLSTATEKDYYYFSASADTTYYITVALGTLTDSVLELLDSDGIWVLLNNNDATPASLNLGKGSRIVWRCPTGKSGTYYLKVISFQQSYTGTYSILASTMHP